MRVSPVGVVVEGGGHRSSLRRPGDRFARPDLHVGHSSTVIHEGSAGARAEQVGSCQHPGGPLRSRSTRRLPTTGALPRPRRDGLPARPRAPRMPAARAGPVLRRPLARPTCGPRGPSSATRRPGSPTGAGSSRPASTSSAATCPTPSAVADLTRVLTDARGSVHRLAHIDVQPVDDIPPLPDLAEVWSRQVDRHRRPGPAPGWRGTSAPRSRSCRRTDASCTAASTWSPTSSSRATASSRCWPCRSSRTTRCTGIRRPEPGSSRLPDRKLTLPGADLRYCTGVG